MSADPGLVTDAAGRLAFAREIEHPIEVPPHSDPVMRKIDALAELLDSGATARVLRLTPHQWREMGRHERRALLDWTVARIQALEQKAAFMSRNIAAEPETPTHLRAAP